MPLRLTLTDAGAIVGRFANDGTTASALGSKLPPKLYPELLAAASAPLGADPMQWRGAVSVWVAATCTFIFACVFIAGIATEKTTTLVVGVLLLLLAVVLLTLALRRCQPAAHASWGARIEAARAVVERGAPALAAHGVRVSLEEQEEGAGWARAFSVCGAAPVRVPSLVFLVEPGRDSILSAVVADDVLEKDATTRPLLSR